MIRRVYSSLATFKTLEFREGLNILMARKEAGATDRQTRNRAGKSSLVELIHFLSGADAGPDSLFRSKAIVGESFGMTFDLNAEKLSVSRAGKLKAKLAITENGKKKTVSNTDWTALLGQKMFKVGEAVEDQGRAPSFRSLFSYFVRRQKNGAFTTPEKQAAMQQTSDYQIALLFLLGLDWQIASDWQKVRDREKTLAELRKATKEGAFDAIIGKSSELRTQLTVAEARLTEMQTRLTEFRVLPEYGDLETEANRLTRRIGELSNANVIDRRSIKDLEIAVQSESPPSIAELKQVYEEAGISLPGLTIKRYEEVHAFHESVVRNRRDYLRGELDAAQQRLSVREQEQRTLAGRLTDVMNTLKGFGALDQFSKLQSEVGRQAAEVESFRQRYAAAEQLEGTKIELDMERNRLALRLRREFTEQRSRLDEAILAFEDTSKRLYESAGSMTIDETLNGPQFQFPIQGKDSTGIKKMQIFCFDMMLMRLCAKRKVGPGFLVHDSHLFDGVDGRQIVSALKLGAETARELGFQYIVTMNEDDAFKESADKFNVQDCVLPVVLTDAKEDGGLFGIRF